MVKIGVICRELRRLVFAICRADILRNCSSLFAFEGRELLFLRPEHSAANVTADRWTGLDREINAADQFGAIDLRPEASGIADPDVSRLCEGVSNVRNGRA